MTFTIKQFREWGAIGGRMRAQRLSKARRKEIARQAGAAKKNPVGRPKGSVSVSKVVIEDAIALYKDGKTLEEIGSIFGVTRERVRQLLKKHGVTSMEGGRTMRRFKNIDDKKEVEKSRISKKEKRCVEKWGIPYDQYLAIVKKYGPNGTPKSAFTRYTFQRKNAKHTRDIEWNISFKDWFDIWMESGRWDDYGRGQGKYVMARWGDSGGYTKDNVKIISAVENSSDQERKTSGLPVGVRKIKDRFVAVKMIAGKSYHVGTFKSAEDAHEAYLKFVPKKRKAAKK